MGANPLLGPLEGVDPEQQLLWAQMAQKSLDFQGPPLPTALEMDLPSSKSFRPAPYKQQVDE